METADSIVIELKVLVECLKKKELALSKIASITENQGDLLASGLTHEEIYSIFMQMNDEKQESIQRVMECDQVFENVFRKVGPVLDANPTEYGDQVLELQELIRVVMDLDVQIRVGEEGNSRLLTKALERIRVENAEKDKPDAIDSGEYGSNKVINAYKSQSKRHD